MADQEPWERLKWARERAHFPSPKAAADKFHWNYNTYKSTENGERGLTRQKAHRYGTAFKVSPAWLLTGEGPRESELESDETELLLKYRAATPEGRAAMQHLGDVIAGLAEPRRPLRRAR